MKVCSKCNVGKPLSEYHKHAASKDGLQQWCKSCKAVDQTSRHKADPSRKAQLAADWRSRNKTRHVETTTRWKRANVRRSKNASLVHHYGITIETYESMLEEQGHKCAICGNADSGRSNTDALAVDHDHRTGAIRGLLCHPCNSGIGLLKDDATVLTAAAEYLRRNK